MMPVNAIVGWQFPESTIAAYLNSSQPLLLTMDYDFPCAEPCNLRCRYCFVKGDHRERERDHYNGEAASPKLSVSDLRGVFSEAATLGCRSAKLVGDQEPLQEPGFLPFLDFVSEELRIWTVVFTNGVVLADDALCTKVHGCDADSFLTHLKERRVSVMLKFHSYSVDVEDGLVGTQGYASKRNRVLARFMSFGFNDPPSFRSPEERAVLTGASGNEEPENWTRLGLESVITPQCFSDAEAIYRRKACDRLYVDLDPPVPVGLTRSAELRSRLDLQIPPDKLLELAIRIYSINKGMGIPFKGASPYFGGLPCSQLPYGLYVNARGRIYPCCGCPEVEAGGNSDYLGSIREIGLDEAIKRNPYRLNRQRSGHAYDSAPFNSPAYSGYGLYHGCPYRDRAGDILPEKWELRVQKAMEDD